MTTAGHQPWTAPLERARVALEERFARQPDFAAAAPGRVNLIGEHTDYNEGFVLPVAIDRYCVAVGAVTGRRGVVRAFSCDVNQTAEFSMSGGRAAVRGLWSSYVEGVAVLSMEREIAKSGAGFGVDIAIASDVPVGGGLSSSASLETAVAVLFECLLDKPAPTKARAALCRRAEHEFAGVPCGIMDQLASSCGRAGHAMLIDCRDNKIKHVPLPDDMAIAVIDSGVRHALASGEYAARRSACAAAASALGVKSLRDIKSADAAARLSGWEARCVRHVVSENARVKKAAAALSGGDAAAFGKLMNESHASLTDDYAVSCRELDEICGASRSIAGVFGARMTGGGFGGSAVALLAAEFSESFAAALRARLPWVGEHATRIIRASDGAMALDG